MRALVVVLVLVATAGAAPFPPYRRCDAVAAADLARLPAHLSQTGLYADPKTETLAPGVQPFLPQFELWSDGAHKRRWIWLPPGQAIDSSDPDAWQFPVGTKLWKEFTSGGVRVETRFVTRTEHSWLAAAYVFGGDGDADLRTDGITSVAGTRHDVPAAAECVACHGGRRSFVLGFSAVQLTTSTLATLAQQGKLTHTPPAATLTGDARAALGYLHANCSHCHNQSRPPHTGARCFDPQKPFDLSLRSTDRDLTDTAVFRTTVPQLIVPGAPDASRLYQRLAGAGWFRPRMPPLGTKDVDPDGVAVLRAFITHLPRP